MKICDQTLSSATSAKDVAIGPTSDMLCRIAEPGLGVTIWQRARDPRFAQ